jgi:hypothetical protein
MPAVSRSRSRHDRLGMFDAVLPATVMSPGADALVSADRAFSTVRGTAYLDPAGREVHRSIEA